MFSVLRPFLFNLDPETAHNFAIKSLKFNPFPSKMFEVEDEQMLNTELFGKIFPNPIGLAAGFDKSAEVYNSLLQLGFGFVEMPSDDAGKAAINSDVIFSDKVISLNDKVNKTTVLIRKIEIKLLLTLLTSGLILFFVSKLL